MDLTITERLLKDKGALVVAHPGHELRVFGWLEISRPKVFVITDGSGRFNQSRVRSTAALLEKVGASPGTIFGRLTDQEAYKAILNNDAGLFVELANELSDSFVANGIDYVVGDARERYNPVHDLCRSITDAAAAHASRRLGRQVRTFSFSVVDKGCLCGHLGVNKIVIGIDKDRLTRKLVAANSYSELKGEVSDALATTPLDAFRTEFLYEVSSSRNGDCTCTDVPFYERYGEQQVAAGHYQESICYARHIAPLDQQLENFGNFAS